MGRLIILILVIITVIVLWRAFGPGSSSRINGQSSSGRAPAPQVKGPEDDPEFLWEIKKERFKQQREAQRLAQENLRSAEQRALSAERRANEAERRAREAEAQTRRQHDGSPEASPSRDKDVDKNSGESGVAG